MLLLLLMLCASNASLTALFSPFLPSSTAFMYQGLMQVQQFATWADVFHCHPHWHVFTINNHLNINMSEFSCSTCSNCQRWESVTRVQVTSKSQILIFKSQASPKLLWWESSKSSRVPVLSQASKSLLRSSKSQVKSNKILMVYPSFHI